MGSLPSDAAALPFTDIEGSTKLAQKHAETWERLPEGHDYILLPAAEAGLTMAMEQAITYAL